MIITIVWLLVALTISILLIGYWNKLPFVAFIGWAIMFLMSANLIGAGVDFKDGEETYYVYGNFYGSYHWDYNGTQPNKVDEELFHTVEEDTYANYSNHLIFYSLAILSGLGFVSVFFTRDLWEER